MPASGSGPIVIHFPEVLKVFINGIDYSARVLGFNYVLQRNNIGSFEVNLFDVEEEQRVDVAEKKVVQFRYVNNLLFKGTIESVVYETYAFCTIKGIGTVEKILKDSKVEWRAGKCGCDESSDFGRPIYAGTVSGVASTAIVAGQLSGSATVLVGTNSYIGHIVARADYDSKLNFFNGLAGNLSGVWWGSYGDYPYNNNYFNIANQKENNTVRMTFNVSGDDANAIMTSKELDEGSLANSVTFLGYGDGSNQIYSKVYHATDNFTRLLSGCTVSGVVVTVEDSAVLPASGTVWVGMEQVPYTGKTGNALTGCTRQQFGGIDSNGQDYLGRYAHSKGVVVFDAQYTETSTDGNSRIDSQGLKQSPPYVDKKILDQDSLDLAAVNALVASYDQRETIVFEVSDLYGVLSGVLVDSRVKIVDSDSNISGVYSVVKQELNFSETSESLVCTASNFGQSFTGDLSQDAEKVKVGSQYMQGSTSLFNVPVYENCDSDNPLSIRFYLPEDLIKINKATLNFKIKDYRSYSNLSSLTYKITEIGGGSASTVNLAIGPDGSEEVVENNLSDSTDYDISNWIVSGINLSDGNWRTIKLTPSVLSVDNFETGSISSDWKEQTGDIKITSESYTGNYGVMMSGIASMETSVNSIGYGCWFKQGPDDGSANFVINNISNTEIGSINLNYTEFRYRDGASLSSLYSADNNVWYGFEIGYSDNASRYTVTLYDSNGIQLVTKSASVLNAGIVSGVILETLADSGIPPQILYYWDDIYKSGQARIEANLFVKCFIQAK